MALGCSENDQIPSLHVTERPTADPLWRHLLVNPA